MSKIAGLILSGGKSSRMGGIPKALCKIGNGSTFLEKIYVDMIQTGLSDIYIVGGAHFEKISAFLKKKKMDKKVELLYNASWQTGMLSSLLTFFENVCRSDYQGVIMNLIDYPVVNIDTYVKISNFAYEDKIIIPIYKGKKGHPVFWGRKYWSDFYDIPPEKGPREVNYRRKDKVELLAVEDKGIICNINTPEEYEKIFGKELEYES